MYSVDHPAAERSLKQTWDLLVPLLKDGRPFTFGFMNQRVLLNSSLVSQTNLAHLEVEFSKREIAAITFQAGVAQKDFKRALTLLSTRPMAIAERGGIREFLAANPIEGVHIVAAPKPKKGEEGMIEVGMGMGMESFLTAQAVLGQDAASSATALDQLLDFAGVKSPGVGAGPRELVAVADAAARNTVKDPDGDLGGLLVAVAQVLSGLNPDVLLAGLPPEKRADLQGCSPQVMSAHLLEDAVAGWAADRLRSAGAGGQGGGEGAGDQGGEAGQGEGSGEGGGGAGNVEREVLEALFRGLKATRAAERLMQKLAQFVQEANLPKEVYERLQREVVWFTLRDDQKYTQLISQQRYADQEFSRLVKWVQEALSEGRWPEATEIVQHYFSSWEKASSAQRAEELKRAPELLRVLTGAPALPLLRPLAESLLREIMDETGLPCSRHSGAANCLAVIARNVGQCEDFEFVHKIASDLKRSLARRPGQHAECCGKALTELLAPESLERLVDSFLQRRSDAAWVRTAASLLVMIGPPGAEAALRRLDEESSASIRLPLIRLIRGLGASAVVPTCQRLSDPRWYVVRNAVCILGDLGDPELPAHLRSALRHADLRVQQAGIAALLKSQAPGRGQILAEALPHLQAGVLEMALEELTVLKDLASIDHLEALVLGTKDFKVGVLEKAVIALGAVPSDRSAEALYRIAQDAQQPLAVRRAALGGLYNHSSATAARWVEKLSSLPPGDPLAAEVRKVA
jgi:HEAT repeat protein